MPKGSGTNSLNLVTMFYIREYSNGVTIHNDMNGCSRLLAEAEVEAVKKEFPQLADKKVRTVFAVYTK